MTTAFLRFFSRAAIGLAISLLVAGCGNPQEKAAAYLAKAQANYAADDLVHARLELRNALQIEPRNARALYLMALLDEREQDYPAVLANLQMAVESDPKLLDARVKLGNYYAVGLKVPETRTQADAAMALDPNNPAVRLLNAWAFYVAGDKVKALDEANNALVLDPKRRDGVTLVASLHAEAGRFDEALSTVARGISTADKADVESLRRVRVALLVEAGRADEAERELQQMVADYPQKPAYDLALARLLVSQGRTTDAEERIRALIARDPDNAEWRVQLAGLLVSQSRTGDAEAGLQQAVRENPESTALRFALAGFYEANERPDEALRIYEEVARAGEKTEDGLAARSRIVALTARSDEAKARLLVAAILADAPTNADALLYRAAYSFKDGKLNEAIADLRSVLVRQPGSQRALLLMARTYVRSGDAALAEDAYRKLLKVNPTLAPARNELAAIVGGRGSLDEAEELLREALEINPADATSSGNLVSALLSQGDVKGAETEARRIISLGETSGLADYQLGVALQLQKDDAQAIAAYKDALQKNPMADEPLSDLVRLLTRTGRAGEAQSYLEQHLKAHPGHVNARVLLGAAYRDGGKRDLAQSVFREVIAKSPATTGAYIGLAGLYPPESAERLAVLGEAHARNPGDPQIGLALGSAFEKSRAWEDAIRVYDEVLAAGGDSDFIVNNLAVLLLDVRTDRQSRERALKLASRFAEGGSHPFTLGVLGWAYYRNGQFDNATRYLERAVAASPGQNPQLRYYLGMAYLAAGNSAGARQELQLAVDSAESTGTTFSGLEEARAALTRLVSVTG